jgi:hypothetical protein
MEGWLQVPPGERNINLIGRAGWKVGRIRFRVRAQRKNRRLTSKRNSKDMSDSATTSVVSGHRFLRPRRRGLQLRVA